MKKVIPIIFLAISLCLTGTAVAEENGYLKIRMWERQEAGIQGVIQCFKDNCHPSDYRDHLIQIVSAETNLIVYGVSPKDKRLVSPLARDVKSMADYPAFAYKLFKKRLRDTTGFAPRPEGSFNEGSYKVTSKNDSSKKLTVHFKNTGGEV